MAPNPKLRRAHWILAAIPLFFQASAWCKDAGWYAGESSRAPGERSDSEKGTGRPVHQRDFRTFLPKPGESIDEPTSQVVQVLLDRQDKGDFDSYMIQVLFRGKPSERNVRVLGDRIEIEFFDTSKPSMRLSKIRGGAVEASALEEYYYREAGEPGKTHSSRVKRMVRLTLFMHEKTDLKFRDTLDRTLIHFRLAKASPRKK